VYEESRVTEYWLADPESETLLVYTLSNGKYQASRLMTSGDMAKYSVLVGLTLDLEDLFSNLD
jgi:Uma2 family endonuclease